MDDRSVVARQLGRSPRAFRRVSVRCPFGLPAVTEQDPYDPRGEPFPTTYYLTCRHLVAAVSRLEAVGGVERWRAAAAGDRELAQSLREATHEQRELRRALAAGRTGNDGGASLDLGIAGASRPERLKCLHAHVAFALARPGYALGERILAEVEPRWPGTCCSLPDHRYSARPVSAPEHLRREWEESARHLEASAADRDRYRALLHQLDAVTGELRKRVGQTYSLAELARAYGDADRWAAATLAEEEEVPAWWPRTLSVVVGAAFHAYARGALDYEP
jgi:hypothetical protein